MIAVTYYYYFGITREGEWELENGTGVWETESGAAWELE
jgi:hypothetical protein